MAARVVTVAFQGVEARRVEVEAQFTSGDVKFFLVGMGDKAISESRERVRAAFSGLGLSLPTRRIIVNLAPADLPKEGSHYDLPIALAIMAGMGVIPPDALADWAAVGESRERVRGAFAGMGLALPAKRIVCNLAPADLPKEGSHYDLPIALAVMAAMGVIPPDALSGWAAIGELGLDGQIAPVAGALPAAIAANGMGLGLICPEACGPEAAWAGDCAILAPRSLIGLVNHFRGTQVMSPPKPGPVVEGTGGLDLRDVKGQESAKRALEIAAAGGHNLLMSGPPGAGKSLLAACLPGILPPLEPAEALELGMIQ